MHTECPVRLIDLPHGVNGLLVYDENGAENRDASRRVEFKFRLHDEQMIMDMAQLLEDFDVSEPAAGENAAQSGADTAENGSGTAE